MRVTELVAEDKMPDHRGPTETAASRSPARHLSPLSASIRYPVDTGRHVVQQTERPALAHRRRQQLPVPEHQVSRPVHQRRLPSLDDLHAQRRAEGR